MNRKPQCIIVTGRPGAGKTTLAKKLGQRLWLPVVSRDEMKAGYVTTFGVKHDELPADANAVVSACFFEIACHYLASQISIILEAAFQHQVWASRIARLAELSNPFVIICCVEDEMAARRHLERGLSDSRREFYHGDARVAEYRATGKLGPPGEYVVPQLDVPTLRVATEHDYAPSLEAIVQQIQPRNDSLSSATTRRL